MPSLGSTTSARPLTETVYATTQLLRFRDRQNGFGFQLEGMQTGLQQEDVRELYEAKQVMPTNPRFRETYFTERDAIFCMVSTESNHRRHRILEECFPW